MSDDAFYRYEPKDGHGLPHDPFAAIIAPRPIGWISSLGADGVANLAPYSFFNAFSYRPPIIGFSSSGWKDSVRNIERSREFVWNLTNESLVHAMNATAAPAAAHESEFTLAGLTMLESDLVRAPRVAESPVHMECRLTQIERLRDAGGAELETWMVLGEVVCVHIRADALRDGVFHTHEQGVVLRSGGAGDYVRVGAESVFTLERPKTAEKVRPGRD